MTLWLRPNSPQFSRFCASASTDASTTRTYCGGSWPAETAVLVADPEAVGSDPEKCPACPACVAALRLAPGLLELKHAPAIATVPQPLWSAEMLDGDGGAE